MNLEEAGHYALSLGETVTEDQFTRKWMSMTASARPST